MLTEYQQRLRDRCLAAPVMPAPEPWHPVLDNSTPIDGLLGIGFATDPGTGHDLVMVVSTDGHGLFDASTGEKIARDRDPDPETGTPDGHPDLVCPGLADYSELRAAGFSPSGRTLAVATSSDLSLWTRRDAH
ncbi:hypothetical protein [Streptomyces prunicolor]|uniref:hypothetical protein n=1 Tax=Streptomyces prunicolor TaxID=67348 RepID=UPI003436F9DE